MSCQGGCGRYFRSSATSGGHYCSSCRPAKPSAPSIPDTFVQCSCCKQHFLNASAHEDHAILTSFGCDRHEECLSRSEAVRHARVRPHNQCWVRGCTSKFAASKGWDNEVIMAHVEEAHGDKPAQPTGGPCVVM